MQIRLILIKKII